DRNDPFPTLLPSSCAAAPARSFRIPCAVDLRPPRHDSVDILGDRRAVCRRCLIVRSQLGWHLWIAHGYLRPRLVAGDRRTILLPCARLRCTADQQVSTSQAHRRLPRFRGAHEPRVALEPRPERCIRASHLLGHRCPRRWTTPRGRCGLSCHIPLSIAWRPPPPPRRRPHCRNRARWPAADRGLQSFLCVRRQCPDGDRHRYGHSRDAQRQFFSRPVAWHAMARVGGSDLLRTLPLAFPDLFPIWCAEATRRGSATPSSLPRVGRHLRDRVRLVRLHRAPSSCLQGPIQMGPDKRGTSPTRAATRVRGNRVSKRTEQPRIASALLPCSRLLPEAGSETVRGKHTVGERP